MEQPNQDKEVNKSESEFTKDLMPNKNGSGQTIVLALISFAVIVAGMFAFAFFKDSDIKNETDTEPMPEETDDRYSNIDRVDAKHFYIDSVHTVVGEIPMPTPCDLLEADAIIQESYPEQITLDLSVINNAEFCAQVITPQRFKVSASASPEATFNALFENRVIELNLVEAAPGETPEEFELFIKG